MIALRNLVLNSWREISLLTIFLLPLSLLYWCIARIHRAVYSLGIKKQRKAVLPAIVVGNLSVGGSGKTPMVIHLVNLLKSYGFRPAVVSRGYKSKSHSASFIVEPDTVASIAGDEPSLIVRRTGVPVAVGSNRHNSIDLLKQRCDVIVCDDGLQHWPLNADVRLCINDTGVSSNPFLLPAGPWREPQSRLASMDIIVERGADSDQQGSDYQMRYGMQLEPLEPINLLTQEKGFPFGQHVHAVAGIAQPERFFDTCLALGLSITKHALPDHHQFAADDLNFGDMPVLMTEKDAVKCIEFAKPNFWYLPVNAVLSDDFDKAVLDKLNQAIKQRS